MAIRESLPTLTEDDLRAEGERITIPTPIPVEVLRRMMAEAESGPQEAPVSAPPPPVTSPPPSAAGAARAPAPRPPAKAPPVPRPPAKAARQTPVIRPSAGAGRQTPAVRLPSAGAEDLEITEMPAAEQADVVDELVQGYLEQLGSRAHVPFASLSPEKARTLQLDHWAGFVLSLADGKTPIQDIIDAAPMPEHDTLRMLSDLQRQGVIAVRAPAKPAPPPEAKSPRTQSPLGEETLTLDDIDSWT